MTPKLTRMIAPLALTSLLATGAVADEKSRPEPQNEPTETGKSLTASANDAAVRDAVLAVLVDTKLDLDIRFRSHTTLASID